MITSKPVKCSSLINFVHYSDFRKHWPVPGVDLVLSEGRVFSCRSGSLKHWVWVYPHNLYAVWFLKYQNLRFKARLMDFQKVQQNVLMKQVRWVQLLRRYKLFICCSTLEDFGLVLSNLLLKCLRSYIIKCI